MSAPASPPSDLSVILHEVCELLRGSDASLQAITETAARYGEAGHARGDTPASIVARYGALCTAITAVAAESHAVISAEDYRLLNDAVDTAIAAAVEAYSRAARRSTAEAETRRLGEAAHELRDLINTAMLALRQVTRDGVSVEGRYLAMLGRSLAGLQYVAESMVSGVRLAAAQHVCERVDLSALLEHLAAIGALHAEYRGIEFRVERGESAATIDGDPQLIASAVMNLLQNAFKNTHRDGHVMLRWEYGRASAVIEVEDECGGFPHELADPFNAFGERRGQDRRGLGLGLAMARDAVRVHGGEIRVKNLPGKGCVFMIELPLPNERAQSVPVQRQ